MVSKYENMFNFTIDLRDTNEMRICLLPIKLANSKILVIPSVSKNAGKCAVLVRMQLGMSFLKGNLAMGIKL